IGNGVTDIKTSKTMYPNGFDVSVAPEGLKIELLAPRYTDIRVTVPDELHLETVNIRITKNPIRDYSLDSPAPSSTDGSEDNNMLSMREIDTSDSADSNKDSEIYEKDNFQLKHLKAVVTDPKVTITDRISQPSEESPKLGPQRLIEERSIFVNKLAMTIDSQGSSRQLPSYPSNNITYSISQTVSTAPPFYILPKFSDLLNVYDAYSEWYHGHDG
ncbi:5914_t:CDS:2, partial [Ambispora leptoticha]